MESSPKNIFRVLLITQLVFTIGADSNPRVKPSEYLIKIFTKQEHFKDEGSTKPLRFDGEVTINFQLEKDANFDKDFQIVLNANSEMVLNSEPELKGGEAPDSLVSAKCEGSINKNFLIYNCPKDALKFKFFESKINYSALFGNDMTGFYRSSYKDADSNTRWLVTTHFEPIFARNAFPCFDKPNLKALFEVHLRVPKTVKTVLCNTPLQEKKTEDDYIIYKFKKTSIPMSTYLVAFSASDFISTAPKKFKSEYGKVDHKNAVERELKTYGRQYIIENNEANLAQEVGLEAINELTEYFKLGYSFEKMDLVGIPDFSAGAMENFGHISFREKSLFYNETLSSTNTKQSNVLTVTHELVHQWFGNLVTLETWDYIWLNEAFANYFEFIISSKFKNFNTKDWNLLNQMVVSEIHLRAFETDGLNSSKSLNYKIPDESLIYSFFSDIPYCKGLGVLRMWDFALPNNGFQNSLQNYLFDRKENFSNPEHLFRAFKTTADMKEEVFKSWTEQPGYPVVEVKKINGSYQLTQSRFFWEKINDKNMWHVPITYSTDTLNDFNPQPWQWLYDKPILISTEKPAKWIIVNNLQAGYYRVNYDEENWKALSEALRKNNYSNIPEVNRAQIINDVFSLARSLQKQYVDYSTALTLSEYLKNETSFVVWKTALSSFDFLRAKLYSEDICTKFNKYILQLVEPQFKNLKASDLDHVGKLKNAEISRWACSLDYKPCVDEAKAIFGESKFNKYPDTQDTILCTVIRSDSKVWDVVFEKYKKEEDGALKVMYLTALGCTRDKIQAERFLNETLKEQPVIRKQDLIYVLSSVYNGNSENIEIAFQFIENNYEKIAKLYGGINSLGKAVLGIAKKVNSKNYVDRLNKLAEKIKNIPDGKGAEASVESALKIASSNALWVQERMDQFKKYFTGSGSIVSYSFALLLMCFLVAFQS